MSSNAQTTLLLGTVGSSLNAEQSLVVQRMLDAELSASQALLVFGPPGTGKTLTLVEGILAALSTGGAGTRMLCCAPSDSAADVLVQRLLARAASFLPPPPAFTPWDGATTGGAEGGGGKWLLRLNSYVRDIESVRPEVVPYTAALDEKSGRFVVPPLQELEKYPLIVTTCATSTLLKERGIQCGHFGYILIDEAAQALEPETLPPLAFKGPASRVVLAGDWKQLGPVVRSRCCDSLGLSKSLLSVCVCVCVCVCVHVYTYTYIHTYTHIHIYTYTYIRSQQVPSPAPGNPALVHETRVQVSCEARPQLPKS